MMYKRSLLALVVVLAVVPGSTAGAVAGEPVLSASLADGTVAPGETTALSLTVLNSGRVDRATGASAGLTQRVTTARALTVDVEPDEAPIEVLTGERAIGALPEGATPPLDIPISVAEDAEPGTYDLNVSVNYTHTELIDNRGRYHETNVTRNLTVELEIEDSATFGVVDADGAVRVGSTGTVGLTLVNNGTAAARDATVSFRSNNAAMTFDGSPTATRYVGDWPPGLLRTVPVKMTAAPTAGAQPYAVDATVTYEDESGVTTQSEQLTFAVTPADQVRFPVVAADATLAVGDTGNLTLTLRNDGPIGVGDATVSLSSTSGAIAVGGAQQGTRFVGPWGPGENRTVTFDLTATGEAEPRSYALRASVTYEDAEGDPGESPTVAVGVTPDPEQGFAFDDVAADLEVGAEGTLNGTVTNTGETTARNLVVSFAEQPGTATPLESDAPVGDLAPGATATFSFPMEVGAGAEAGPRQFTLVATYRNAAGEQRRSETADVRATVAPDTPRFAVDVAGGTVSPGEGTTVNVTVTNQGGDPVSDVSAKLFASEPLSTTDSEAFVDGLDPGESRTVTFGVAAAGSALVKDYPVEMDFQYDDVEGDTLTSQTYRLPISVTPSDDADSGLPVWALVLAAIVVVALLYWGYRRYA